MRFTEGKMKKSIFETPEEKAIREVKKKEYEEEARALLQLETAKRGKPLTIKEEREILSAFDSRKRMGFIHKNLNAIIITEAQVAKWLGDDEKKKDTN